LQQSSGCGVAVLLTTWTFGLGCYGDYGGLKAL
jgi:hypothetical protein